MSKPVKMNEDPHTYWRDQAGPKWVRAQHSVDRIVAPITAHLHAVAAAAPGEQVVDIGCGCGTTTLVFAEAVGPTGHVLGVDISDPMLEVTQQASAGLPQVDVALADASTHAFAPTADLIASRFGVMFFPDPPAAFANIRTALAPGGRTALITWQPIEKNPWISFLMQAFPEVETPMPSPDSGPGPFSMSNAEANRELLENAGFGDVVIESFETEVSLGATAAQALEGMIEVGGFSRLLSEAADDDQRATLLDRAQRFLDKAYEGGEPKHAAAVWVLRARA